MAQAGERDRGFSLLELVTVLAILAIAATLALPRLQGTNQRAALQSAVQQITAALKLARAEVLRTSTDQIVTFDLANRTFWPGTAKPQGLGPRIAITIPDDGLEWDGALRRVRFRPDGSATGGTIALDDGTERARIAIDWLTGATIRVER